jgi:hypothetical protein
LPIYYARPLVYIPVDQRKKTLSKEPFFIYVFLKVNCPAIKLLIYLNNLLNIYIYIYIYIYICPMTSIIYHSARVILHCNIGTTGGDTYIKGFYETIDKLIYLHHKLKVKFYPWNLPL